MFYFTMVATLEATLGEVIVVEGPSATLACVVVDVSHSKDRKAIAKKGIVVELDYTSAAVLCGQPFPFPPRDCPVTLWNIERRTE